MTLKEDLARLGAPQRAAYTTADLFLNAIAVWRDSLDDIARLTLFTRLAAHALKD